MTEPSQPAATGPKPKKHLSMEVTKIVDHTPQIRELFIETRDPLTFKFRAGQFVMLHVPTDGPKPALRAYSIASDDRNERGFRLIFKAVETGVATNFVWKLKGGELLDFTGPFGRLFFHEPPTEQVVFSNTGSGVSQHICYLESMADKYPNLKYRMLFGVRYEHDIYYRDELAKLARKFSDFRYEFVLSRPSESWTGKRGYLQDHLHDFDIQNIPTT
ncbi:MAG: FAD-binding oxidoreductase, partial [Bdellovibrionaceae bacterium]|nr:FAD-binding oxidoreductase [Pseudobdellovibrionaceae bacterium]